MAAVIYHNPACGTSRAVLAVLQSVGETPVVIEYLEAGWTRGQLQGLFAVAGLSPRQALRTRKSPAEELGLLEESVSDDAILEAMVAHPILVERPFVCTAKGAALCRPAELVFPLLPRMPELPLMSDDGHMILDENGKRP